MATNDFRENDHLDSWSDAIIGAGSYPKRVAGVDMLGGAPHPGTGLTIDTAAEFFTRQTPQVETNDG